MHYENVNQLLSLYIVILSICVFYKRFYILYLVFTQENEAKNSKIHLEC